MQIIPHIYLRGKKVLSLERTVSPLYDADPLAMVSKIKTAGAKSVCITDLEIPHIGPSDNASVIQNIAEELTVLVCGAFRSVRTIETYTALGAKTVALETPAYQQPALVREACLKYPDGIAVHISVRAGRVVIPGWAVAANKTAVDYAEQFKELGVKTFLYSDVGHDDLLSSESLTNILALCKNIHCSVIVGSEIRGSSDIEKLVKLGAPGLDGIVVTRALYEGRLDLKAAIDLVADLSIAPGNEPTLTEL